jgi:hypothetical protein
VNPILRYLTQMVKFRSKLGMELPPGFNYIGGEDYVLDRGSGFASAPLTPEEHKFVRSVVDGAPIKRWLMGNCYYNAQILALSDRSRTLTYHEGWASGLSGFLLLHGWVTINGKVVDMTWRTVNKTRREKYGDRILGVIPEGWGYCGAPFSTDSILARWKRTHEASSFLDDVVNGFPLFREPRLRSLAELLKNDPIV